MTATKLMEINGLKVLPAYEAAVRKIIARERTPECKKAERNLVLSIIFGLGSIVAGTAYLAHESGIEKTAAELFTPAYK